MINELRELKYRCFTHTSQIDTADLTSENKPRLEYIDLAKGICIFLVVMLHFSPTLFDIPNLVALRMPLYFTLSGLFFKSYGGFKHFFAKKSNNILLPYLIWVIYGVLIGMLIDYDKVLEGSRIEDFLHWNIPMWFLLCLFNASLIFYFLQSLFKGYHLLICVVLLSVLAAWMKANYIYIPLKISSALIYLPFYYLGYVLKDILIKLQAKKNRFFILSGCILIALAYSLYFLGKHPALSIKEEHRFIDAMLFYVNGTFFVSGFLMICKVVNWLPVFSYIGRYSLIVLCVHFPLIGALVKVYPDFGDVSDHLIGTVMCTILYLSVCLLSIPLCKKFLPYFVAQKNIFKILKSPKKQLT